MAVEGTSKLIGTEGRPFPAWLSFHLNNRFRRHSHPPEGIIDALGLRATDAVLDFGCGPGFYAVPFAKVAREVVAVDLQPEMLQKASQYAEKNRVKIKTIQSNGQTIPIPDGSFDMIFLSGVYHELTEKKQVLAELNRVLKPGGRIVIRERTEDRHFSPGRPKTSLRDVSDDLRAAGFVVLAPMADPSDKNASIMTATKT